MKSTKNLLMTGLTLTMVLFTSVHITAIVNPHLTPRQKTKIENTLGIYKFFRDNFDCNKKNITPEDKDLCERHSKVIPQLEAIYYGDRKYSDEEIDNAEKIKKGLFS